MDEFPLDYEIFDLGDVALQGGATLRDAKLAYKTYGELNADKSNAIVYPTWYSGRHWDNEWLIGDGMALDPAKYFIIVPNMLGNGLSTSPSNTPPPYNKARFPDVTFYDQVSPAAQAGHREVRDRDAPARHRLVDGRGADLPVGGQLPGHGAARAVLRLVEDERAQHRVPGGRQGRADRRRGVQGRLVRRKAGQGPARGRARYAGWGFSQAFYWDQVYKEMGYSHLEDFLVGFWEGFFLDRRDPNNLLTMLWTWQTGTSATPRASTATRSRP